MELSAFIILGLATWRITSLLAFERGPWRIFTRIRELVGIKHGEEDTPMVYNDSELSHLFRCVACGSVWIALCLVGLYIISPWLAVILSLVPALSAAAIILERGLMGLAGGR